MNCTHLYLFIYLPISEDYSNFLRESRKQFITEIYLYIYTHGSIMCRYTTYKLQNISSFLLNKTTVLYIHLNYFAIFHHFVINLFNKKTMFNIFAIQWNLKTTILCFATPLSKNDTRNCTLKGQIDIDGNLLHKIDEV